jgi:O-methyltransferase
VETIKSISYKRTAVNVVHPGRRYEWNKLREQEWHPDIQESDFWEMVEEFWEYTVLGSATLYNIYSSCQYIFSRGVPGDIVECGVYMGGSIMFFAEMCKRHKQHDRTIFALDTFGGFLRRGEEDVDWSGQPICFPNDQPIDHRRDAENNIRSVGWQDELVQIVQGDVVETAPKLPTKAIAILRLDTDTYDTTRAELEALYPRVSKGGVVIIDDYGWGMGSRAAVDEYFQNRMVCLIRVDKYCRAFVKTE